MIELNTSGTLGKGFSAKREKDDDHERVVCHLKFTDAFISREQIDEFCRQPLGWHQALFDEGGAPVAKLELGLIARKWTVTGTVRGTGERPPTLNLLEATLTDATIFLTPLGGALNGSLSWTARGDEVDDLTGILGTITALEWRVNDGGQADLLQQLTRETPDAPR